MYGRWNAGVRELSDADLENPPTVGPERFPMENRVLHVNRELIHHGAEISLLRDLYRWQDGASSWTNESNPTAWQRSSGTTSPG